MQFIKLSARTALYESGNSASKAIKREGVSTLECLCIQEGIRITAIRLAIIETLEQASGYLTAEEIDCRANNVNDVVSMSAAYCTLRLLAGNQISRRKFQSKQKFYSKIGLGESDRLIDAGSG